MSSLSCLSGGGEMGALMRSYDWASTPLGAPESWPQCLRTAVGICLNSQFPMQLWWGADFTFLYNDACRAILADKHPAALGMPGHIGFLEIWDVVGPMLKNVRDGGAPVACSDTLLRLERNGRRVDGYFTFSYSPVFDEQGKVGGILTPILETTERVIGERRLQVIGNFTRGFAHDFNNLLTAIIAGLDMITRRPAPSERVERFARVALDAAERGERLVRQLMMFADREATRPATIEINRRLLDLRPILRHSIGDLHALKMNLGATADTCAIDASQFDTAILTLVLNAHDAMPDGGLIEIETANVELPLQPEAAALGLASQNLTSYIQIAVKDHGRGVAPDVLNHAFELDTARPSGGFGLSQVFGFAQHCGGHVRIEGGLGKGTQIYLELPRSEHTVAETALSPQAALNDSGTKILLVDDDARVLDINQLSLEDLGCQVLTARSGGEALAILKSVEGIDLLFSDIVMPGGPNGFQLAREARQLQPSIKILLTSGYAPSELAYGENAQNEIPVLRKPYHREKLRQAIASVLGHSYS
jgi:signal transduction histidine kinase/CheY-like chemotaxis protein